MDAWKEDNIQGISLRDISDRYDTPLYIYNSEKIHANYHVLKSTFQQRADVFYSLKANPNISIAALLSSYGAGAEVCSSAELETALQAGFAAQNIIFVGPLKKSADIKKCLALGIYAIVCESKQELEEISRIAKAMNITANIGIRINPAFIAQNAALKMGGKASQFGIDQEEIIKNADDYLNMPHINVIGIHVYNGTRILDIDTFYSNTSNVITLLNDLEKRWRKTFTFVDIGGGIGIPYFEDEVAIDIEKLGHLLAPLIQQFNQAHPKTRLILESGRFLVGNAGMLVTKVHVIKESRHEKFLITDGGTNCHMAAVGIGSLVKRNFPIYGITNHTVATEQQYHITGPLCTPNDLVGKNVTLPSMNKGDLVVIAAAGAYGPSASPVNFLSHGFPAEVLVKDHKTYLIRERDSINDLLAKQILVNEIYSNR